MSFNFTHNPRKIYHLVVIIWVILFVTVMSGIVAVDLQRAEKKFAEHANMHLRQANDRVHTNESILEGFAAMVSTSNSYGRARIRSYAQKILKQYPHIFKFEIVEKVSADKLESFVEYYHRNIYPDFKVKAFSYESDRQWQEVEEAPYHLVIVFMEPSSSESRELLGLDIGSNEFLVRSLQKSEQQQESAVSTDPFTLVQGHLAYLLQRPIAEFGNGGVSSLSESGAQGGFVQLVILADTLLDRASYVSPGMRELLYSPSFSSTDPKGHLHLHEGLEAGWLESRVLPRLSINKVLESRSQPFVLFIEQQLGWSIISWGKLGLTLMIA